MIENLKTIKLIVEGEPTEVESGVSKRLSR